MHDPRAGPVQTQPKDEILLNQSRTAARGSRQVRRVSGAYRVHHHGAIFSRAMRGRETRGQATANYHDMYKQCPLKEYEPVLESAITSILNTQFSNRNFRPPAEKPKNLKGFQDMSLNQRLHLLNAEGLFEVAQEIGAQFSRFKAAERQKAKASVNKAWAQGRLILCDATRKSVLSLVEWAYDDDLHYNDAEHLYAIWALATRLQFGVLAEECMNRLYNSASTTPPPRASATPSRTVSLFDLFSGCPMSRTRWRSQPDRTTLWSLCSATFSGTRSRPKSRQSPSSALWPGIWTRSSGFNFNRWSNWTRPTSGQVHDSLPRREGRGELERCQPHQA
ncbi:uncharacterized protein M421DRAFT_340612 [Didymella exigua CBS 183.55]|uniref:BTB domain-containing protein n=1 Tax=Didymella exigua CBS 183.55 TaxID=1150837 RepID=A0A6A5RTI6_9PLEO|nr:uncharacterized protein M421DRAFT_340612 [Didymella exigua CBS 183.55]KAF1931152.1 hypothetical protein M421DRAFT_340612 [Didymella exigua CBS 183.55]